MAAASPNFQNRSYWLDQVAEAPVLCDTFPASVDVLIVGSGYTGLNSAIVTAGGGRSTLVLDAEDVGFGCSTRNGGQISTSVKPSLEKLTAKFGERQARAIRQEGSNALDWIGNFVDSQNIDCDYRRSGRFHAAHTPQHYESLVRDAEKLRNQEGIESFAVPRAEQRKELGSDSYFGGVVFSQHCSLHPAKYHRGLLDMALTAGATVVGNCAVQHIENTGSGFKVQTQKGELRARQVIVATNGYTSRLTPWLQRRVIPIGSYLIATEELPKETINTLFPTDRIASDTCKVVYYYRTSPDRKRIIFGGRVAASEINTKVSGPRLYQSMCRIFPELTGCKISHSWSGTVAYTFDELAHTGVHDGVHYALGYCGSGVSMASYLGMRTGQKVLGLKEGQTAFDPLPHPTRPLYTGRPWFLPAAVAYYRAVDDYQWRNAAKSA